MLLGHGRLAGPVTPSQVWLDPARGAADGLTQEGEIDLGVRGGGRPTGVHHLHIFVRSTSTDTEPVVLGGFHYREVRKSGLDTAENEPANPLRGRFQ
jgi:hypothetical protein